MTSSAALRSNTLLRCAMLEPPQALSNKLVMLMSTTMVRQLGNSAAVILPKALRSAAGIEIGDQVSVDSPEPGTVVIKALDTPWTLASLMNGYDGAKPSLVDTSVPVGKELW